MGGFRAGPGAITSDLTGSGGATFDSTTLHVDDDNDRVGIGTTSPTHKFAIYENRASNYAALIFNDGDNANRYGLAIQAGPDNGSGTTYYIIAKDGDGNNTGTISTSSGEFALADVSDFRLKDNIRDTAIDGLEIIKDVQVRDFEMKKNGISKTGFIAQELKQVLPSAVVGEENDVDDNGDMIPMSISYTGLIPALIKAVQQLNKSNEELTAKVAELENK